MPYDKIADMLSDGEVATSDPRFRAYTERVVNELNMQLERVRDQWHNDKISHDAAFRRAQNLKLRAREKITKRIPQRAGAPMTRNI
jgi:hypothetical protein